MDFFSIGKKIFDWTFFFGKYGGKGSSPQENSKKKYQNLPYWAQTGCFKPKKCENGQIRHFLALFGTFFPKKPILPPYIHPCLYGYRQGGGTPPILRSMAPTLQLITFFLPPPIYTPPCIYPVIYTPPCLYGYKQGGCIYHRI